MPNPTPTVFLPYHALDDVIMRGTRASQALASAVTPGALYCVTDEQKVERSNGTVWESYSSGSTLPPNIAYTDAANVFTQNQIVRSAGYPQISVEHVTYPMIQYYGSTGAVDAKRWRTWANVSTGTFQIDALNDAANLVLATPLTLTRGGNPTLQISGPTASLSMYDATAAVDAKLCKWQCSAGSLALYMLNDGDSAVLSVPLTIYRNGNVTVGGQLQLPGTNPGLKFGGATSAYPALRDGNPYGTPGTLEVVSADTPASVYAPLRAAYFYATNTSNSLADLTVRGATNFQSGVYASAGNLDVAGSVGCATNIWRSNFHSQGYVYPGQGGTSHQADWFIQGHGAYGIYCNTGFYVQGNIWSATALNAPSLALTGNLSCATVNCSHIANSGATYCSSVEASAHIRWGTTAGPYLSWDGSSGHLYGAPTFVIHSGTISVTGGKIQMSGDASVWMQNDSPNSMIIMAGGYGTYFRLNTVLAVPTNAMHFGTGTYSWYALYAYLGTIQASDAVLKERIQDNDLGLAFVNKLKPRKYFFKKDPERQGFIGFTTQEVEEALEGRPFAAIVKNPDEPAGLNYAGFVPILTTAIQELSARLQALEARHG